MSSLSGPAWLGLASLALAVGAFLLLAADSSNQAVIAAFWALEGVAALVALTALFWRGVGMPAWSRGIAVLTLAGQALFVWILARGLSQLT
jgi:hypothetical protein